MRDARSRGDGFGIEYDERYIFNDVEQELKDASLQDAKRRTNIKYIYIR
jgi:hypothetical protein